MEKVPKIQKLDDDNCGLCIYVPTSSLSSKEKLTKITFNKTFIEMWRLSYWPQVIKLI